MRHGSVLYPRPFVELLPAPNRFEHRPLLLLLKGEHRDPEREIERIERWFTELKGREEGKRRLGRDMQSLRARNFWSALHELMTSRIFVARGWPHTYEVEIGGVRPDFLVEPPVSTRFIAEVLTIFEPPHEERAEEQLYVLASALDTIQHPLGVFIENVRVPARTPRLTPLIKCVRDWLERCPSDRSVTLRLAPPEVPVAVTLTTVPPPRDRPGPIIQGIVGVGGKIAADETIWSAISEKVRKYRRVKRLGVPFVLVLWEGDWLKVSHTSLEWALFGREQLTLIREQGVIRTGDWQRAPGGLFAFGHDGTGDPRNTRISAVAYCARHWHEGNVYVTMRIYHHPYAAHRLPIEVFAGIPQCVPVEAKRDRASCQWDREAEEPGIVLH